MDNDDKKVASLVFDHAGRMATTVTATQVMTNEPGYIHGFMIGFAYHLAVATQDSEVIARVLEDCAKRLRDNDPNDPNEQPTRNTH